MGLRVHSFRIGIGILSALALLVYCSQWSYLQQHWASRWQPLESSGRPCRSCVIVNKAAVPAGSVQSFVDSVGFASSLRHKVNGSREEVPTGSMFELYTPPFEPCKNPSAVSRPSAHYLTHGPFITESKNPCWWNSTGGNSTQTKLHCLPYFFLAGVSKCGSTDIFARLSGHPQVVPPSSKEPRWFDWKRFKSGAENTFARYVSNFIQAAWQISRDIDLYGKSDKVVGDGSPTYLWRNFHWAKYLGNEGCLEPRYVVPHTLHSLLPQARIIISFRNPVDSIYSKYLSRGDKGTQRSPQEFHKLVEEEVQRYKHCFSQASIRRCAYNTTLSAQAQVRLEKGLYGVFLSDWFRVFPRKQFHIVRFEDYIQDIIGHLQDIFDFLDLKPMADRDLLRLVALPPFNKGHHYSVGQMLPATRQLLARFYAPFNAHLAHILNNKKYLWADT